MIIVDNEAVVKNRKLFSARGAGILGFSMFGSKRMYALDENMELKTEAIIEFLEKYKNEQVFLHVHSFIASYLKEGIPSIQLKWYFEYKKWVRIVPRDAYLYLKFSFMDKNQKTLRA